VNIPKLITNLLEEGEECTEADEKLSANVGTLSYPIARKT
jgi:hypothetical protein